ncbi:hypothetical protein H1D31_01345 [Alishewanella sp. BS5-314]|uniref:hypothetical protein n=1 Tax=Alishewanella sp. BS5-314 TaxID=2755587 RepID=UPI0021BB04E8|nr:hypothetical protein [Alishewanella sp. BS5-314]MCT8124682.1 hypothetical protein [Alishewanella sp. BS5-314]
MSEELVKFLPSILGVFGVIWGSIATYRANINAKLFEFSCQIKKSGKDERVKIFSEYLSEVNKSALYSLHDKNDYINRLQLAGAYLAQIELLSSPELNKSAQNLFDSLLNLYAKNPDPERMNVAEARAAFVRIAKIELAELDIKK